jgi:hypothetical protein
VRVAFAPSRHGNPDAGLERREPREEVLRRTVGELLWLDLGHRPI